jgi:hypothetical protein
MDKELCTIPQLAKELTDRTVFKGVIIFSKEECKDGLPNKNKQTFSVFFNENLERYQVINLLRKLANVLEKEADVT